MYFHSLRISYNIFFSPYSLPTLPNSSQIHPLKDLFFVLYVHLHGYVGVGVTGRYELPDMGAGIQTLLLYKSLLTTEPSPKLRMCAFLCFLFSFYGSASLLAPALLT